MTAKANSYGSDVRLNKEAKSKRMHVKAYWKAAIWEARRPWGRGWGLVDFYKFLSIGWVNPIIAGAR